MDLASSPPLPNSLVELIAHRLQLLGELTRLGLIKRLRAGKATVHKFATAALAASEQNASRHRVLMANAGIFAQRRQKSCVYHGIAIHLTEAPFLDSIAQGAH